MLKTILSVLLLSVVAQASEFTAGEIIVKYKDGAERTHSSMNALYHSLNVQRVERLGPIMQGFEKLTLDPSVKLQDALFELRKSPMVEIAQPNYILHALPMPKPRVRPSADSSPIDAICAQLGIPKQICDQFAGGAGGIPGGGGGTPGNGGACLMPGVPYPPGCKDSGLTTPRGGDAGTTPTAPNRPALNPQPAEVVPPVADPDLAKAWGISKTSATEAHKTWGGSKNMVVAIIDTGMDYNHEDLAFNVWRNPHPDASSQDVVGYDFVHNDGLPFDDNEHGTHCSGVIGAVGGNGIGISGINERVSLMAVKFISNEGSGTTADAVKAIDYAVSHGAKVLSNSWGGAGDDGNDVLKAAIDRAKDKDVLFVAAAGNDGLNNDDPSQASYPAGFDNDNLISVAATDEDDSMAFFSNYGLKTTHLAAPGTNVYSTVPGNKYASLSGTSMAAPHVAGAAALVWSKHPTWHYQQVKAALLNSVDKLTELSSKTVTGGRLNVAKALEQN